MAISVACASTWATEPFPNDLKVVRVDTANHRLFVAPATQLVKSTAAIHAYIARLSPQIALHLPDWGAAWSVSFFGEARFAAYKDEAAVLEAVKTGVWAKSYLAEFDNASGQLVWFPADPAKVRHDLLKEPQ